MRPRSQPPSPPAASTRALAAMLALLVFGLHLLASAPAAHAWLHRTVAHSGTCLRADDHAAPSGEKPESTAAHPDTACAVSVFAQGLSLAPSAPDIAAPRNFTVLAPRPAPTRAITAATGRLHPPAHAPPEAA